MISKLRRMPSRPALTCSDIIEIQPDCKPKYMLVKHSRTPAREGM